MPKPTITIDLSIDFDFFAREHPLWDWNHLEDGIERDLYEKHIWYARYQSLDLYGEMDPGVHCECMPGSMADTLAKLLPLRPKTIKRAPLYIADHHSKAFDVFFAGEPPTILVHIDAHHDAYWSPEKIAGMPELNLTTVPRTTDNWVQHYLDAFRKLPTVWWVPPRWQIVNEIDPPHPSFVRESVPDMLRWDALCDALAAFTDVPVVVRHILLVRSPAWTPPHMDATFWRFVFAMEEATGRTRKELEPLVARRAITRAEAKLYHESYKRDLIEKIGEKAARFHGIIL